MPRGPILTAPPPTSIAPPPRSDEAKANVAAAQAALDSANAELAYQTNNFHRIEPLLAKQFVTADQVDQVRTAVTARQQTVQQASLTTAFSSDPGSFRSGAIRTDQGRERAKPRTI